MRLGKIRWFILSIGALTSAGCESRQSAGICVKPMPPAQPFVFYDEADDPSAGSVALSEAELREVIDWVATQTPDPIWLIRVGPAIGKSRGRMVAYLVPDKATPRIRVGRGYDIPELKEKTVAHSSWTYAQVALPSRDFGNQLARPTLREMPFRYPAAINPSSTASSTLSEEEMVAALDFVRHQANGIPIVGTILGHTIARGGPNLPVLAIRKIGATIEITYGYQHGPLWGHGTEVTIKRAKNGYKVMHWREWVS
jgi:hypothetical protein